MKQVLLITFSALFYIGYAQSADKNRILPIVSTNSVYTTVTNAGLTYTSLAIQMQFLNDHYNMGKEPGYSTVTKGLRPQHRKSLNNSVQKHRTCITLYLNKKIRTAPTYEQEENAWKEVINESITLNWPITYRLKGLRTLSLAGRRSELAQYPSQKTTC